MTDYLLDEDNDLLIVNGDFVKGECTQQNQKLLLFAQPGAYKQYPTAGVGIYDCLKDDSPDALLRAIRLQFTQDGMQVKSLAMKNGKIEIYAPYSA